MILEIRSVPVPALSTIKRLLSPTNTALESPHLKENEIVLVPTAVFNVRLTTVFVAAAVLVCINVLILAVLPLSFVTTTALDVVSADKHSALIPRHVPEAAVNAAAAPTRTNVFVLLSYEISLILPAVAEVAQATV